MAKKDPEQRARYVREWSKANPEKRKASRKKTEAKRKEQGCNRSNSYFLTKYGINRQQYLEMARDQDGKCAICRGINDSGNRALAVDHNHDTGQVRGLLCYRCNLAIGLLKDSTLLLDQAQIYLVKHDLIAMDAKILEEPE